MTEEQKARADKKWLKCKKSHDLDKFIAKWNQLKATNEDPNKKHEFMSISYLKKI